MQHPYSEAAWFRAQRARNPVLFQPAKAHILTLQAPRKPTPAETQLTGESKEFRSQIEQRLMPVQDVTYWLRYCRDTRNPHIPLAGIARAAKLSRMTVWRALTGGDASLAVCWKLTPALRMIAAGRVPFRLRGNSGCLD